MRHILCCSLRCQGAVVLLVGMAKALQDVTLKRGDEELCKFRAGTQVNDILHELEEVCPGAKIKDSEGFRITLTYPEDLPGREYTVIVSTTAGVKTFALAHYVLTLWQN